MTLGIIYADAVWAGDSLLAKPRLESVTLLSALASATRTIRLGVACLATASALTLHFNVKRVYLLEYHGSVMSRYLGSPSAIASHSLINSSNSGEDDDSFSFARASASEVK